MATHTDPVLRFVLEDLVALAPFGFDSQVRLLVEGSWITGTPISEEDYFAAVSIWYQAILREASDAFWSNQRRSRVEREKGWSEQRIGTMTMRRERILNLLGEQAQGKVRSRVLDRPDDAPYFPPTESQMAEFQPKLDSMFSREPIGGLEYIHLKDCRLGTSESSDENELPMRIALSDISAWNLIDHEKTRR